MSRVATERGERYRKQLASHFDNKIEVAEEPWSLPGSSLAAPGRPGAGAMLDRMTTAPEHPEHSEHGQHDDKHRLTAVQGLAALSLDALSSVAYGPEAILVVLVAAGAAGLRYSLPITGAIIILLVALVVSYRQVIAAFPGGGGAYAVAKAHLGTRASLVAAASLIVDYVLNAAVGVSAGVAALTSAFPALYGARVWLCLGALALITGLNLWGVAESAKVFTVPTLLFIVAIAAVILGGLVRAHPAVPLDHHIGPATETVGLLLILRAFASGCSALTGVEAIANAVPEFRQPRARRAQATEVWLGILLGLMLIGLGALIHKFSVVPQPGITVLAQLTQASLGHNIVFYGVQLITLVLLALAANTSFGGLPVLAALLAKDNFLPHMFGLRADRQVHRYGVITLALLAAALLVAAKGDTQALVPLFAIGVFVGFTLSQVGMVRHWRTERSDGWIARAAMNGAGALLTAATTLIELVSKFTEGAWLIVLVIPGLVLLFSRIHHTYQGIGALLELGQTPKPPARKKSLVVVPVASISRLTAAGISTALSIGDDVTAVKVCFTDPEDEAANEEFRRRWEEWHPNVPLVTLRTAHRSIAQPIVKYLTRIEAEERYHQLVVLIPEVQPPRFWDYLLFNRRGAILERAIRHGTANVVLCRLHYRLEHFTPGPGRPADSAEPAPQDRRADRGGRADGRDHGQARVLEGGGEDLVGNPEQSPER
jgi:amino acid transporter